MKKVTYFRVEFMVPAGTKFLATNKFGDVLAFYKTPARSATTWEPRGFSGCKFVGKLDLEGEGVRWFDSLIEFEK